MNELLRVMQVIYSSWIMAAPEGKELPAIPTGSGAFDYALKNACEEGLLPEWARSSLHFTISATGLVCLESEPIQRLATEAKITSDSNPSYIRTNIEVSKSVARHLLRRLEISEQDARRLGEKLRAELGVDADGATVSAT